ncbi:N-acetylmuramoyl-L-alanine amidase [Ruminococcaceae bacterium OttesenSCG-928-A16]|nr:N-acetylmuramoyl-L-alanine amidase [Ruminococcaceae bacterium OttesenSCG-928-A16]
MQQPQPKQKKSKKGLVVFLLIILLLLAGAAGFFMLNSMDALPLFGPAPQITQAPGPAQALTLAATSPVTTKDGYRAYFKEALAFAAENEINTLVFNGKTGLAAYWRDNIFPAAPEIVAQDGFMDKLDPLALLCEEAQGTGIQIWLRINPYSATGYTSEMKGSVANLAGQLGGASATAFAINDEEYNQLLVKSLTRLPHKYPIAGLVFDELDTVPAGNLIDNTTFNTTLAATLRQLAANWSKQEYQTSILLGVGSKNGAAVSVLPATAQSLVTEGVLHTVLPSFTAGSGLSANVQQWANTGAKLVAVLPEEQAETVLFTAALAKQYAGALFGSYPAMAGKQNQLALLKSTTLNGGTLPAGFAVPTTLGVQYPTEGQKISWNQVYITGSSNPDVPLFVNGAKIETRSSKGTFGVLVPLTTGNNVFTFTQQGQPDVVRTIVKPQPTGGGTAKPITDDATREAQPGQAVRLTPLITSALTNPGDDASINETFYRGGVAIVQQSVQTRRYNSQKGAQENTWAYLLTSGDYVLARNCAWVNGGNANFTGLAVAPPAAEEAARSETLAFTGSGTPAAYLAYNSDTSELTITMYNTSFTLPDGFSSTYVKAARVAPIENGVQLILTTQNMWGYQLQYNEGTTSLYLKGAPTLANNPTQPLTGITVMLDAGHGGTDIGAYGLLNTEGFFEKDVNLQLAQATAYRLRQLGATVLFTREDDSFPSLDDRLAAQITQKPDFYISIHHDAVDPNQDLATVQGIRCFYYHPYNQPPAKQYAENLIASISDATGRTGKAGWGYYYVTRTTVCPSVLFEYGFLNNPVDFAAVTDIDQIYAAAGATANAIMATVPTGN